MKTKNKVYKLLQEVIKDYNYRSESNAKNAEKFGRENNYINGSKNYCKMMALELAEILNLKIEEYTSLYKDSYIDYEGNALPKNFSTEITCIRIKEGVQNGDTKTNKATKKTARAAGEKAKQDY